MVRDKYRDIQKANREFFEKMSKQLQKILGPDYYSERSVRERKRINSTLIKSIERRPMFFDDLNKKRISIIGIYDAALLIARERYKQGGDKNVLLETAVLVYEQAGKDNEAGKDAYKVLKEAGYRSVAAAKKHLQKAEEKGEYQPLFKKK